MPSQKKSSDDAAQRMLADVPGAPALGRVAGLAVLLVAPGFALLYFLQQRRMLTATETDADLRLAAQPGPAPPGQPAAAPARIGTPMTTAVVLAMLAITAIRDVFSPANRR